MAPQTVRAMIVFAKMTAVVVIFPFAITFFTKNCCEVRLIYGDFCSVEFEHQSCVLFFIGNSYVDQLNCLVWLHNFILNSLWSKLLQQFYAIDMKADIYSINNVHVPKHIACPVIDTLQSYAPLPIMF